MNEICVYDPAISFCYSIKNIKIDETENYISFNLNEINYCHLEFIFWKKINYPRIQIHMVNTKNIPFDIYYSICELYEIESDPDECVFAFNLIKTILSNKITIFSNYLDNKIVNYEIVHAFYYNNLPYFVSRKFNCKLFLFPCQKKSMIKKEYIFEPWIKSEYTII